MLIKLVFIKQYYKAYRQYHWNVTNTVKEDNDIIA